MKRLVIVGAGISGLCAAHEAAHEAAARGLGLDITVLEAGPEVGGKARSVAEDGWLVEEGPTGYLDAEPEFDALLQRAGAAALKVTANDAAARRYLLHGRLRELRANPIAFAGSGILGPGGLMRVAAEPFIRRAPDDRAEAESIWDFAARRLGSEAADKLIAPMVLGVFAGDARSLSLTACFPKLAKLEREHGSLIRGMLATRKSRSREERFATGPTGKLVSTASGLQSIPRALAGADTFTVRCNARVRTVEEGASVGGAPATGSSGPARASGTGEDAAPLYRVVVAGDREPILADAVILAGEAFSNAEMVERVNPAVAAALREIVTPAVVVVAMGFGRAVARRFPTGFGVLIPRDQGYRILGCLWDSQIFDQRCPEGHLLVRAMLGGGIDPGVAALDDDELTELTRVELDRIFGLPEPPIYARLARWERAIPQYDLAHPRRCERVRDAMGHSPGIFLAGNGLDGVAFAKSAATGARRGRQAAEWLAAATGDPARAGAGAVAEVSAMPAGVSTTAT